MRYHFKIHKEGDGFWAECLEISGCVTQGDSKKELELNMKEALNLALTDPPDSKFVASLPDQKIKKTRNVEIVSPDPQVAFAFMVRYYRIKHGMTQNQIARKMGFSDIYNYQRLESSRSNPTLKTILKIKEILPEMSLDVVIAS